MTAYVDFDSFGRTTTSVAQIFRPSELFSMMKRRVNVPPGCAAVVWGDGGGTRIAIDGSWIESEGAREILLVRTAPVELSFVVAGLTSQDGHFFTAHVEITVRPVGEREELVCLRNALLGSRDRVDVGRIRIFCEETVRATSAAFAAARSAADLSSAATWDAYDGILAQEFKPMAFQSGLSLGQNVRVSFSSPSYAEAARAEQAARLRRERLEADAALRGAAVEARKAHLTHLAGLIEQVRTLAAQNPGAGVAELIRTFDPIQRGELYQGLLASARGERATEAIVVVAGEEMLWLDPARPDKPIRRESLASPAGGLRSVRVAAVDEGRTILVGAGRGVHVLGVDQEQRQTYQFDSTAPLRGGFNAANLTAAGLFATHSEIGVVRWARGEAGSGRAWAGAFTAGAKSVRDIQSDAADRLWFSSDERVIGCVEADEAATIELKAPAVVTALHVHEGRVIAGLRDGRIVSWLSGATDVMETLRGRGGGAVESLVTVGGGGVARLVFADGSSHVEVRVLGDSHGVEYRAPQPVKWAFAADDWIVAVNAGRDQVLLWKLDTPDEPVSCVSIGRMCGHSIQDAAILPSRGEPAIG